MRDGSEPIAQQFYGLNLGSLAVNECNGDKSRRLPLRSNQLFLVPERLMWPSYESK